MPSALNLNVKPLSVGIIPAIKYCPSQIDGTSVKTKRPINIFVDNFMPLVFVNNQNVCKRSIKSIKLNIFAQIKNIGGNMDKNELMVDYLNAVYQNTRTGIQSLEEIMAKVEDDSFKKELALMQDEYQVIANECEMFAKSEKIVPIKDNNWFEKSRLWASVNMSTMMDKSNRKIAELLLIGTFMGIITCIKDEKDHVGISKEIDELLAKLKKLERDSIEKLIPYLD